MAAKNRETTVATRIVFDGETPVGVNFEILGQGTFDVRLDQLDPVTRDMAACHGLKRKIGDGAALERDKKSGASATPAEKWAEVIRVRDQVLDGQWNVRGGGDGGRGLMIEALMRATGTTREEAERHWDGWAPDVQAAMKTEKKIVAAMAQIRAERARVTPDAQKAAHDALAGLMQRAA